MKLKKTDEQTHDNSIMTFMIYLLGIFQEEHEIFIEEKPSSPYSCRPLIILNKKETTSMTKHYFELLQSQIKQIENTHINFEGMNLQVICF